MNRLEIRGKGAAPGYRGSFENHVPVEASNPSIEKNSSLCSDCGHCLSVCAEEIGPARRWLAGQAFSCINCGQCVAACPERALTVKSQLSMVREAVRDPETIVVISTAPSVRVGLGDAFGLEPGAFVEKEMAAALRALGADYVYDVTFSADLTIMEEGTEFLKRLLSGSGALPQFTSCCPAWVKYAETFLPELLPHISTAKSPISMQGATIKTYLAKKKGIDPRRIVSVAVAPCTAKKFEITRPEFESAGRELNIPGLRDNDYVLTTKELARWMKEEGIDIKSLAPSDFDPWMGRGSGAGLIFGNTGGVMEAALRMAYSVLTGKEPDSLLLSYQPVRGLKEFKVAEAEIAGKTIRAAVIYGTEAAERHLPEVLATCHFVEVMTCPGGCISGAGQPEREIVPVQDALRRARIRSLYQADEESAVKCSLDNPDIQTVYREFYGEPMGEKAERLLHTGYYRR